MGQQERFRFSMWYLCVGTEGSLLDGSAAPSLVLSLGTLPSVPELHDNPVWPKLKRQRKQKKRPNSYDSCGWKLCKEVITIQQSIKKSPRLVVVLSLTRKVFLTQSVEANLQLSPCKTKRWAVEGLALREAIGRIRTLLRWCYSEANVADALTKVDNRAHELLRKFLQSRLWRIVWDPEFTSSKKLKQQKKGKKSRTS